MKYEFIEINNFIVAQASAEHYEADFKLYRKLFPESRLLRDLENPFPPQKKELDERMLYEILNADRICIETILENRGVFVAKNGVPGFTTEPTAEQLLANVDLSTLKYNEAKSLVYKLKLPVENQSFPTLKKALAELIERIVKSVLDPAATADKGTNGAANTEDANVLVDSNTGDAAPGSQGTEAPAGDGPTGDPAQGDQGNPEKKS